MDMFSQLLKMGGVMALIVMVVNIGKFLGWVKDGQAENLNKGLQLLALVGLWALKTFWPELTLGAIDTYAQSVADLGVALLGFVPLVLSLSGRTHETLAGRLP